MNTGVETPYSDATRKWIRADALEQFAEWYFGVTPEMLQEKANNTPGSYDAGHGYCDVNAIGIELTPIVDASLVGYSENEDGTFTMVVVLQVIHPGTNEPSEFGNDPLEVVVDMRSGHPVFLSAKIKEL